MGLCTPRSSPFLCRDEELCLFECPLHGLAQGRSRFMDLRSHTAGYTDAVLELLLLPDFGDGSTLQAHRTSLTSDTGKWLVGSLSASGAQECPSSLPVLRVLPFRDACPMPLALAL